MEFEVFSKLQPAIGMRQGQSPFDIVRHSFGGGVGEVVEGQNDHVIADAYAAVLAAKTVKVVSAHSHHLLVFRLWICTSRPLPTSATARLTSWPYFKTVSPALMSRRAILWPGRTSSTTTTPTVSALSCTMNCVAIRPRKFSGELQTLIKVLKNAANSLLRQASSESSLFGLVFVSSRIFFFKLLFMLLRLCATTLAIRPARASLILPAALPPTSAVAARRLTR